VSLAALFFTGTILIKLKLTNNNEIKFTEIETLTGVNRTRRNLQWASGHPAPLDSKNIVTSCDFHGEPMCCAIAGEDPDPSIFPRDVEDLRHGLRGGHNCHTRREYVPSAYELRHFAKALEWENITDGNLVRSHMGEFVFNDLPDAAFWVGRVHDLMQTPHATSVTEKDQEFLSHFRVMRSCPDEPRDSSS